MRDYALREDPALPAAVVELRDAIAASPNYTDVGQPYPVTTPRGTRWVVKARLVRHKGMHAIAVAR